MGVKNKVIAGSYEGNNIIRGLGSPSYINSEIGMHVLLTRKNVATYELITEETRKSLTSGAARGVVGSIILGPIGAIAGALSATSVGIYHIAIEFKNGDKCLLEIDKPNYKNIVKYCF